MLELDLDTGTTDWVIDYPVALRLFKQLGVDYTCGGKSLAGECQRRNLDHQVVLMRLRAEIEGRPTIDSRVAELQLIRGYRQDESGDWVAELSCGHFQHVRHDPPWMLRSWVVTEAGRNAMIGFQLPCKKCFEGAPADWQA